MITALPTPVFLVALLLLLAMAGVAVYAGLTARRRTALVSGTPTTPIGMATDGYREFEGTIEAVEGGVKAPLTQWPCVWYHAKVEKFERIRADRDSHRDWKTVKEWTSGAPFLVRDATGVCIVDPHRAEVTPTDKSLWYGATQTPTDRNPAKVGPTESAKGMVEIAGTPNAKFRYSEERMYAGDPLLVLGEFSSQRFNAGAAGNDEDDEDETDVDEADVEAGEDDDDADSGGGDEDGDAGDVERDDALFDKAQKVTRATIARGSGAQPFIVTTTSQAQHVALTAVGGSAALGIAAVPLALALLLLWARFG